MSQERYSQPGLPPLMADGDPRILFKRWSHLTRVNRWKRIKYFVRLAKKQGRRLIEEKKVFSTPCPEQFEDKRHNPKDVQLLTEDYNYYDEWRYKETHGKPYISKV